MGVTFKYILFYGTLWGLAEAFPGTLLHLIPLEVTGYLMFAAGLFCMMRAYFRTQKWVAVAACGLVAALFKLATLFFYTPPFLLLVIKPAAFILVESVGVMTVFAVTEWMRILKAKSLTL